MKNRWINWLSTIPVILLLSACGGSGDVTPIVSGGSLAGSSTGLVSDTGQTTCYYDIYNNGIPVENACLDPGSGWSPNGQDGYYTINAMSFTDNSDGTILDNVTALTWQKCSLGESGTDCLSGTRINTTWSDAKNQCAILNLVGTGWRLPTIFELTQIVNYGKGFAIDTTIFPSTGFPYWSSTTHANQIWAWYVYFIQDGIAWANNQTEIYSVRCVRG